MGNISRDTFDDLKRYVGVRLQQGVPLVDADWNELEDIRRFELRAYLKWFVGNGVPDGNNGFAIRAIPGVDNDFMIMGGDGTAEGAGRCLVEGLDVFNPDHLRHSEQLLVDTGKAAAMGVPPVQLLTTPSSDITYTIFLDVWEREVFPGEPGDDQDIFDRELINETIGVPTCTRYKREWAVRMVDASLPFPTPPADHYSYPLAELVRRNGDDSVNPEDITDLRRTGLAMSSQHDINQITRDAFGNGYSLDGDGEPNLKVSLRDTINALLRGTIPKTEAVQLTMELDDYHPHSVVDTHGDIWVFWNSYRTGNTDIWYRRYVTATGTWEAETQLTTDTSSDSAPFVLLDKAGSIWVFWYSYRSSNYDIWCNHLPVDGVWAGPEQISTASESDTNQTAVLGEDGRIWVFWHSSRGGNYNIYYSIHNPGGGWSAEATLTTDTDNDRYPVATVNATNGRITVFWRSNRSGNDDIWYKYYDPSTASWSSDSRLTFDVGADYDHHVISDAEGRIWVFWRTNRSGNYDIWFKRGQLIDYGFGEYWQWESDTQLTTDTSYEVVPRAMIDKQGDVWVFWEKAVGDLYQIWYKRHSQDGGWSLASPLSTHPELDNGYTWISQHHAVIDNQNDIHVFWEMGFQSYDYSTYFNRIYYSKLIPQI